MKGHEEAALPTMHVPIRRLALTPFAPLLMRVGEECGL